MDQNSCSYIDNYKVHGLLADGGQASVYFCSKNNQLYAAKVYRSGNSQIEFFKKQVEFLSKLQFKYLINIVGSNIEAKVKLPDREECIRSVIFLEFADGGELFQYVSKKGPFNPKICRTFMKMLIEAIQYLNSVGVSHRDLKPENILFDRNYQLKVSDFGLSTLSSGHDGDGLLYSRLGTEGYKPPEMQSGVYSGLQADLFAAGVILFVIYSGTPPFLSTKKQDKIYRLIRENNFDKFWSIHEKKKKNNFPQQLKKLFNSFFSADVSLRPTFQTLQNDKWLNSQLAKQEQISTQMKNRYQKIFEQDNTKQKIQKIKLQLIEQIHEKQQKQIKQIDTRSISQTLQFYHVHNQDIVHSSKCQLVGTNVSAAVLISWFEKYMREAFESKNTFLKESSFDMQPINYNFEYDEQNQLIKIEMAFRFKDDPEEKQSQSIEELVVHGHVVQLSNGKISVDWEKVSGNVFWLTSIVCQLNSELKVLA